MLLRLVSEGVCVCVNACGEPSMGIRMNTSGYQTMNPPDGFIDFGYLISQEPYVQGYSDGLNDI